MDSLLANYASSDEEQEQENQQKREPKQPEKSLNPQKFKVEDEGENDFLSKPSRKILDSLPPPKSSLFNSLPPPKSHLAQTPFDFKEPSMPKPQPQFKREELEEIPENRNPKSSSTSLFSSLPQPKSSSSSFSSLFSSLPRPKSEISETPQIVPNSMISSASFDSSSKRVVQFRPPPIMNPISTNAKDEEEDSDEDEKVKQRKKSKESVSTSSVKSFLSSIPAPKNSTTLGALPSASGTGRRSMLETDASASNLNNVGTMRSDAAVNSSIVYSEDQSGDGSSMSYDHSNWNSGSESYGAGYDDNVGTGEGVGVDYSNWKGQTGDYANYGAGYGDYGQYESNWIDESGATAVAEASRLAESGLQVPGKRGRNDTPEQIVEVKQDELLKNRPREDQVKLTGIAFGPAYKPASTKGKPTKLHKRKHQIGSLLYDLRQKEMELAERRAKGSTGLSTLIGQQLVLSRLRSLNSKLGVRMIEKSWRPKLPKPPTLALSVRATIIRSSTTSASKKVSDRIVKLFAIDPDGNKHEVDGLSGQTLLKTLTNRNLIDPASHRLEEIDACSAECEVHIAQEWLEKLPPPPYDEQYVLKRNSRSRVLNKHSRLGCQVVLSPELQGMVVALREPKPWDIP
ncbi:proline-rich protein PRCC [Forsythia ovata]|uniref:Proline-rich protein PRCC n=1 Tax=Forsythia ovata TaxID=205694 RepID=A0ABD1RMJ2_9LAMI